MLLPIVLKMYLLIVLVLYLFQTERKCYGKDKYLGLHIDSETHKKLKSPSEFDGHSINGEVLYLIRQAIAQHEHKHGTLK